MFFFFKCAYFQLKVRLHVVFPSAVMKRRFVSALLCYDDAHERSPFSANFVAVAECSVSVVNIAFSVKQWLNVYL